MARRCWIHLSLPLLALFAGPAAAQTGPRGEWRALAPMPSARQEVSTAVLDGKIYVIAGYNAAGQDTSTVEVYDPAGNSWSAAAPLPIETNHNAAAVAAGRLYAFGGTSDRVFVYNPGLNNWSEVARMQFRHGDTPAVAVIDGKIYVAGGTGPGMTQREAEVYDPAMNQWSALPLMSVPRNHCAGAAINGKFYVVAGRSGVSSSAITLEVYDPLTNLWRTLTPMPTGRSGVGAAVVNGELYVFGGEIPSIRGEVEVYNPLSNTWRQLPPMPTPRHGIFAAVIGNTVYLPGGATQQGFGATNIHEAFVVNTAVTLSAASYAPALAAGAIAAAFGAGLSTASLSAEAQPLPTELGGTTVRVRDALGVERPAPLFFVSAEQVNYQIPSPTPPGPVIVTITSGDGRVTIETFPVVEVAPAVFTLDQSGTGAAAALDAFTFAAGPFASRRPDGTPNAIAVFGTGLGADATDVDGDLSASVTATLDGVVAPVLYAGRAPGFAGLNQWNILLPTRVGPGARTLLIARDGVAANPVTVEIR
ncbi:MAG TPA: kelch repeat-containing protein [Blastocatellia bacterium]|nr:kelch repeat-containing protein [Blastocatellia bacterium]